MSIVGQLLQAAAFRNAGRLDESEQAYRAVLQAAPDHADAMNDLGVLLVMRGRADDGIRLLRRAGIVNSIEARFPANLTRALLQTGDFAGAELAAREAIRRAPEDARADHFFQLSRALDSAGNAPEALVAARKAIELDPQFFEAWLKLANLSFYLGRTDDAVDALHTAASMRPDDTRPLHALASIYWSQGLAREFVSILLRAVELEPHNTRLRSDLLFAISFHPDFSALDILRANLQWDRLFGVPLAAQIQPHSNDRSIDRRLRIAYVSPYFREHVQELFTVPILSHHDHARFEIFCYSDVTAPTAVTAQLRGYADAWRDVAAMSDAQLADLIRADGIDILVDLTMHMAGGRPGLFARKPAPVQVAYLAYPGTTGLAAMDYRLSDPYLDPPGDHDDWYAEQSIRLPGTFWVYDPRSADPPVGPLPALAAGHITFGCLNNFIKTNDAVFDLWAAVLNAVHNSTLLLLAAAGSPRTRVLNRLGAAGIDPARIEFVDRQPRDRYLQTFNRVDISLDTFPSNGHTTSLDSFWMGVPVVTLIGGTVVGRAGWSIACNLDLRDLAGQTPGQFVQIAARLASDLPKLAALRSSLRSRMRNSPLMDGKRFTAGLEQAYREIMWRRFAQSPAAPSEQGDS